MDSDTENLHTRARNNTNKEHTNNNSKAKSSLSCCQKCFLPFDSIEYKVSRFLEISYAKIVGFVFLILFIGGELAMAIITDSLVLYYDSVF